MINVLNYKVVSFINSTFPLFFLQFARFPKPRCFNQLPFCFSLTSREAVPDLQPVVSAENTSRRRGVGLQLEALELQNDLGHLGGEDHECAVQVVGVFLREAGRLYDAAVGGEVPGALGT